MRLSPEQEEHVDAVNQAMRSEFYDHLAAHAVSAPDGAPVAVAPRVLFVRSDFDAVLGDEHDELAAKFRRAARIAASCNATASWDATAVYGAGPGEPACWRIVLG